MASNIKVNKDNIDLILIHSKPLGDCLFESCFKALNFYSLGLDIKNELDLRKKVTEHIAKSKTYDDYICDNLIQTQKKIKAHLNEDCEDIYLKILEKTNLNNTTPDALKNKYRDALKNKYVEIMQNPGEWGGDIEIACIKELFGIDIAIYYPEKNEGNYLYCDNLQNEKKIRLYHLNRDHYDLLLTTEEFKLYNKPLNKNNNSTAKNITITSKQKKVESLPNITSDNQEINKTKSEVEYLLAETENKELEFENKENFTPKPLKYSYINKTNNSNIKLNLSDLNPFTNASIDEISKEINLDCDFSLHTIFNDFYTIIALSEKIKTNKSLINENNSLPYNIYKYFKTIHLLENNNLESNDKLKHTNAKETIKLLNNLLIHFAKNEKLNHRYLNVCNLLAENIQEKALSNSLLLTTKLPLCQDQISNLRSKVSSESNKLDDISMFMILHIYEQDNRSLLHANWQNYLKICYALATLYNTYNLRNISHLYLEKCLIIYKKIVCNINYHEEEQPEKNNDINKEIHQDLKLYASVAVPEAETMKILNKINEGNNILKISEDIAILDMNVQEQVLIWQLLEKKYGSYTEEELIKNDDIVIFDDFEDVLLAKNFDDACEKIARIINTKPKEISNFFKKSGCKDQHDVQKFINNIISDYITNTLSNRKKLLNQLNEFHETILKKITSYEFITTPPAIEISSKLNSFISKKYETDQKIMEVYKKAINFCVKHEVITQYYAQKVLMPYVDNPKINYAFCAKYLLERLKFLARTAVYDYSPNLEDNENRLVVTFKGYSAALSLLVKHVKQIFTKYTNVNSEVRIFLTNELYVDCDIEKELFSGVNLNIIAPNISLIKRVKFNIDLSAYDTIDNSNKSAKQPILTDIDLLPGTDGKDGIDGHNGINGKSAGNFNLFANKISGEITIHARGGNASSGADGGNGTPGIKGRDGENGKRYFDQTALNGFRKYQKDGSWLIDSFYGANETEYPVGTEKLEPGKYPWHAVTTYVIAAALGETSVKDMKGGKGGSGGNAGAKGLGGKGGFVQIKILSQNIDRKIQMPDGIDGNDGTPGKGQKHGEHGHTGIDYGKIIPRKSFWKFWEARAPEIELNGRIGDTYFNRDLHKTSWAAKYYGNLAAPRCDPADENETFKDNSDYKGNKANDGIVNNTNSIANVNSDINVNASMDNFEALVNSTPIIGNDQITDFALSLAQATNSSFKLNRGISREQFINFNHSKWIKAISDRREKMHQQIEQKIQSQAQHVLKHKISSQKKDENIETQFASKTIDALFNIKVRIKIPPEFNLENSKNIRGKPNNNQAFIKMIIDYNKKPDAIGIINIIDFLKIIEFSNICPKKHDRLLLELFDQILNESIMMLRANSALIGSKIHSIISNNIFKQDENFHKYFTKKLTILQMLEGLKLNIQHAKGAEFNSIKFNYQAHSDQLIKTNINLHQTLETVLYEMQSSGIYCENFENDSFAKIIKNIELWPFKNLSKQLYKYNLEPTYDNFYAIILCLSKSLFDLRLNPDFNSFITSENTAFFKEFIVHLQKNLLIYSIFDTELSKKVFSSIKDFFIIHNFNIYDLLFLNIFGSLNDNLFKDISNILSSSATFETIESIKINQIINNIDIFSNLENNYLYLSTLCNYGDNLLKLLHKKDIVHPIFDTEEMTKQALVEILFHIFKKRIIDNNKFSNEYLNYLEIILNKLLPNLFNDNNMMQIGNYLFLKTIISTESLGLFVLDNYYCSRISILYNMSKLRFNKYLKPAECNDLTKDFYDIHNVFNDLIIENLIPYYIAKNSSNNSNLKILDSVKMSFNLAKNTMLDILSVDVSNKQSQLIEKNIICIIDMLNTFIKKFTIYKVAHVQIKIFEDFLANFHSQIKDILKIDPANFTLKTLLERIDFLINLCVTTKEKQKHDAQYHIYFDILKVSKSYQEFMLLTNYEKINNPLAKFLDIRKQKYNTIYSCKNIQNINLDCSNYFYIEYHFEKSNEWFTINNQLISVHNNITFAIIELKNGTISYLRSFSSVEEKDFQQLISQKSLTSSQAIILNVTGTTLKEKTWNFLGIKDFTDTSKHAFYLIYNQLTRNLVKVYQSGTYKCYQGLLINLNDVTEDSPLSILEVIQNKCPKQIIEKFITSKQHTELQPLLLSKVKDDKKEILPRTKILSTVNLKILNKLNTNIEYIKKLVSPKSQAAIFHLSCQMLKLAQNAIHTADYETIIDQNNMLEAIINYQNSHQHNPQLIENLIRAGLNFSHPKEIIDIIDSDNIENIDIKLCLERFSECILNSIVSRDPVKLSSMMNSIGNLEEKLLNIFYKKYVNEYYNVLYRTQNSIQKQVLEINEERLVNIINILKKIKVNDECLIDLINTPIINWENELYRIHSEQFIQSWPELLSKCKPLNVFMLNRIRLRLGSAGFHEYIDFLMTAKKNIGNEYSKFEILVKNIYYNEISFSDALSLINSSPTNHWDNKNITQNSHNNEELNYNQILQIILAKNPELEPKILQIRSIAKNIKAKFDKISENSILNAINYVLDKSKIQEYFKKLEKLRSIQEREKWLFEKDLDSVLNIEKFVTNICLAWLHTNKKGFLPRETQLIALLLYLYINEAGLLLEIKTGQGKTIVVALLAAVKSLLGYKVDIVTSNTNLADSGHKICCEFYAFLNLQSGTIPDKPNTHNYYEKHILYSDSKGYQRDICMSRTVNNDIFHGRYENNYEKVCLIVDEVDSLSLDKASDMLYLTHEHPSFKYHVDLLFQNILMIVMRMFSDPEFKAEDFNNNKDKYVTKIVNTLMPNGKFQECLEIPEYLHEHCKHQIRRYVMSSIQSVFMKVNDHFKFSSDHITIMDKPTGSEAHSTTFSDGLQQSLDIAHGYEMTAPGLCSNFISNQSFFKRYKKNLYGMTGTLGSKESREFLSSVYNTNMIDLPTHLPSKFKLLEGKIYTPKNWAYNISLESIKASDYQPILIICENISDVNIITDEIEKALSTINVKRNIISYKDEKDNLDEIFENRNPKGASKYDIIIATNKGGRGTDIPINLRHAPNCLHVILSYLPSNYRIEQQAFGRAARNGEPGSGNFMLSVDHITKEDPQLQIERMIIERDAREQVRVQIIQEKNLPQVNIREELLERFNILVKNAMATLQTKQIHNELQNACLAILNHRWAFWLESIKDDIDKITYTTNDLCESLKNKFTEEMDVKLGTIFNHSKDILTDIIDKPEDAILIANVYLKKYQYESAIKYYKKAIDLGFKTSYPEQAISLCYANLYNTKSVKDKKYIRDYIKKSLEKTIKQKSYYEKALGLQDLFEKAKANPNNDRLNLNTYALESKVSVLSIHVAELTKNIGKELTHDMIKSALGNVSDDEVKNIYQLLQDKIYITTNFIRKKWVKPENQNALHKMLAKEKQFFADSNQLFAVLSDKANLGKNVFLNQKLLDSIYCSDEIANILIKNSICHSQFKECVHINIRSLKDFKPKEHLKPLAQKCLSGLTIKYPTLEEITLYREDEFYNFLVDNNEFFEQLQVAAICKKSKAYNIKFNKDYSWNDFNKIDFGKYNEIVMPSNISTLVPFKNEIWAQLQEAKKKNAPLLLLNLPFATQEMQIKALSAYLHQECFILKSNTLNTSIKYAAKENELKHLIREVFKDSNTAYSEKLLSIFRDLQGNIRKIDGKLVLSFVEPQSLNDLADNEHSLKFDFFEDIYLHKFLSITESKLWFYIDLLILNLLAIIQLAAGIALIILCPGIGAVLGEALIELAIQDFYCAFTTYMSGERLNWSAWAVQKGISTFLTIGSSLTFGFGVPVVKGSQQIAGKILSIIAKSIAIRAATMITSRMLDEFIKKISSDVVEKTSEKLTENTKVEFSQTFDQLEQLNDDELYLSAMHNLRAYLGERLDLVTAISKRDTDLTDAVTTAVDGVGKIVYALTKDSGDSIVKSIGTVISAAATVSKLSSVFQQICRFEDLDTTLAQNIHKTNETVLKSYMPSDIRHKVKTSAMRKTQFSQKVNNDVNSTQQDVKNTVEQHIYDVLATPINNLLTIKLSGIISKNNKEVSNRQSAAMHKKMSEIKVSFLCESPPESCTGNFSTDHKIKKYSINELQQYLNAIPEMPRHLNYSFTGKLANQAQIKQYSKNLDRDPYGLFELNLIANKEHVGIRLFNTKFEIKDKILPQESPNSVAQIIDVIEETSLLTPRRFLPIYNTKKTWLGQPLNEIIKESTNAIPPYKSLLFSVIHGLKHKAPSYEEIDNYRNELISFAKSNGKILKSSI